MDLRDLVEALMAFDTMRARQWVKDAFRSHFQWSRVSRPENYNPEQLAVAAGIVELLALRAGQHPPAWTEEVAPSPKPIILVHAVESMPRLRQLCEEQGPEPLRKRRILAPPEFLTSV